MSKNPFKNKLFYVAYSVTVGIFITAMILIALLNQEYYVFSISVYFFNAPYAVIGILVCIFTTRKNQVVALGILLGSLTPLIVVSIITGGHFLFYNGPPR